MLFLFALGVDRCASADAATTCPSQARLRGAFADLSFFATNRKNHAGNVQQKKCYA